MKYDTTWKKSGKNVGRLWHHLYCSRAGEVNLCLEKSKWESLACLCRSGQYGCWEAKWYSLRPWTQCVLWKLFCPYSPNSTASIYTSPMHIDPSFVYMWMWYVHVCGGACPMWECVYKDLRLQVPFCATLPLCIAAEFLTGPEVHHLSKLG